jgi:hypothetical protein
MAAVVSAIDDERHDLAAKLTAAGVAATTDPRAVAPCVMVGVPRVVETVGIGAWSVEFPLWVVSPPPDSDTAVAWRLEQLETVYATTGFARADPTTFGDKAAPAYLATYTRSVNNPAC